MKWDWTPHPVVRIDLNSGDYSQGKEALDAILQSCLEDAAVANGLELKGKSYVVQFKNLIRDAHLKTGEQVAVVIDEYDKPLLSTIDEPQKHKELKSALKGFYGVLKSSDAHLRFSFLTGVTKFSKVSIFSDLNNLTDISMDPRFADICGITQEELEGNFAEEISLCAQKNEMADETYKLSLKKNYNGYRFTQNPLTVYNPFGLLKHFYSQGEFAPWWFESGSPSFLLRLIEEQKINVLDLENMSMGYDDMDKADVENMRAVPVLYQSGYLTIKDYKESRKSFKLGYPNDEVKNGFSVSLLEHIAQVAPERKAALVDKLLDALEAGNVDAFMESLKPFYNEMPSITATHTEYYYQVILQCTLRLLGMYCKLEEHTVVGRIDAILEAGDFVYVVEFKAKDTAEAALAQIHDKNYALSFEGRGKKVFKIGVEFSEEKRNIGRWVVE
jgi:hypothetical protein